jgi:hypothetical protein
MNGVTLAIFSLCQYYGSTLEDITVTAQQLCPAFSADDFENALMLGIKSGAFVRICPVCIDWCAPRPPTKYSFGAAMDRAAANRATVMYLLGLVGGLMGTHFNKFFLPYKDPKDRRFRLYPSDIFLD